jgi:hypothetical protein
MGFVNIEMVGLDGGVLAERRLERTAPCNELAEAVAVIVAAWQAEFSPALAAHEVESPLPVPPVGVAVSSAKVESSRPLAFDVGIGVLTSIIGGEVLWGAKLQGAVFPFASPLGLDVALAATATHTQSTSASPAVAARWTRPSLSLGPDLRLRGRSVALDLHGNVVLALLHVQGSGLSQPTSDTGVQFGLAAGLRGLWTWNKGTLWVGADIFAYPGQDRLTLGKQGGSEEDVGQLPHLELQVAVGIGLGRFR